MMNALKSLVQWKGSIPQGGLLDFVLKVILALIVYFIGTKSDWNGSVKNFGNS